MTDAEFRRLCIECQIAADMINRQRCCNCGSSKREHKRTPAGLQCKTRLATTYYELPDTKGARLHHADSNPITKE